MTAQGCRRGGQNKKPESWWINAKGYIEGKIWISDEVQIRVKKHRWIMMKYLGRSIGPTEDVHHINGDKSDNRIENLEVIPHGLHSQITNSNRPYPKGYKLNLTKVQRKRISDRAKRLHKAGKLMNPQTRAALAKAGKS